MVCVGYSIERHSFKLKWWKTILSICGLVDLKYIDQFNSLLLQDIKNLIKNDYLFYSSQ